VKIDVYLDGRLARTTITADRKIKLGRLTSAHVPMDDPRVSRMHAMIEAKAADQISVLDLGSVEGTYLNGRRVTRAPLESGDRLQLGPYTLLISIAGTTRAPTPMSGPLFDETDDPNAARTLEVMAQWGKTVVDVHHLADVGRYLIGDGVDVNHFADTAALPINEYVLAENDGARFLVNVPDTVSGDVLVGGRVIAVDTLRAEGKLGASTMPGSRTLSLPPGARCRLRIGALSFFINSVPSAGRVPPPTLFSGVDRQFVRHIGGALGLHALFLLLVFSIPAAAGSLSMDGFTHRDRFVDVTLIPKAPEPAPVSDSGESQEQTRTEPDPTKVAPPSSKGSAIDRSAPAKRRRASPKTRARRRAVATAVADTVADQLDEQFSGLLGREGASASDMGWIAGASAGAQAGLPRVEATSGRGECGHFTDCASSLTSSTVRTRVRGPIARADLGPKTSRKPRIIPQRPTVQGSLSMDVIARTIRQNRGGYRYCYERRLNQQKDLAGKIRLQFVIGSDGTVVVARVAESTMGDVAVESCLTRRMQQTRFPRPKDGGTVVVRYPFLFKSN